MSLLLRVARGAIAVATLAAVVTPLVLGTDQVGPVVIVLDWLVAPPARRPSIATAASWLAFPVVRLVYTSVRAAVVDWYPYPFLDPDDKGLGAVVVSCVGITVLSCCGSRSAVVGRPRRRPHGVAGQGSSIRTRRRPATLSPSHPIASR